MEAYARLTASWLRVKTREFMEEERGAGEIIAAVVVLAIVVVLGIAFQKQIVGFFDTLWENATQDNNQIGAQGTQPKT